MLLGDWFNFYNSWCGFGKNLPNVKFVQFEDLVEHPHQTIRDVASFLNKSLTDAEVDMLATHISLDAMRNNPMTNMMDRKFYKQDISLFLRCGEVGQWKDYLSVPQVEQVLEQIQEQLRGCENAPYC